MSYAWSSDGCTDDIATGNRIRGTTAGDRQWQRDFFMSQDNSQGLNSTNIHYRPMSYGESGLYLGLSGSSSLGFAGSSSLGFQPRYIPNAWEELDMEGDTFQWTNCLHVMAEEAKECTVYLSQTHLSILYTTPAQKGENAKEPKRDQQYKNGRAGRSTDPRALKAVSPNLTHHPNNDLQWNKRTPSNDSIEVEDAGDSSGSNQCNAIRALSFNNVTPQGQKTSEVKDDDTEDSRSIEDPVEISWSLQSLTEAYPRRYRMKNNAIEIFGPSEIISSCPPMKNMIPSTNRAPIRSGKTQTSKMKPLPLHIAATRDPVSGVLISPLSEKSIYVAFQPYDDCENSMDTRDAPTIHDGHVNISRSQKNYANNKDSSERRRRNFIWRLKFYAPQLNLDYWHSPLTNKLPATTVNNPLQCLMDAWRRGAISNYDYLMRLNTISGRSLHDITSYPVLPWVLSNYTSHVLNLKDPKNYRDLSKPMGALHPERLENVFMKRYLALEAMNGIIYSPPEKQRVKATERSDNDTSREGDSMENDRCTIIPPFMYGSHYSTAGGVVLHYLVRLKPFANLHRQLQGGSFDCADRLFDSVPRTWEMCSGKSQSEVKELTKEWYSDPRFLRNTHGFKLGKSVDGKEISDVTLPPWASGSAERFVLIMRMALESDVCSKMLHHWIDLIFG
jgi:hypothetical protein